MDKSTFLKQFAIIGSGTFLNLVIGVLTTPIVTRIVSPETYGQMSIFTMYGGIAVMVLCMGLDQALVRYYYEQDDIEYRRALLFKCLISPLIITLIVSIFIITLYMLDFVDFDFDEPIMIMLCIYVFNQIVYRFSQLINRLERKVALYSALQIVYKILYIIIFITLSFILRAHYLYIMVVGTVLSFMICMAISVVAQRNMWNFIRVKQNECSVPTNELLKYAAPFILSMGITTVFQATDKMFLSWFYSYKEVGIYASTMSLVNIFAVIQTAFNALWAPMSIEHYTKDPEDTRFHQHANQIITVVMFFLGISLILCKDLFVILLGEKYQEAAYILPFLIFNPIMYTVSETTVAGIVFKKKSNLHILVALVSLLTNVMGNALLVPKFGSQGAAISTGISYIVFYFMRTLLGIRYYYVDFKLKKFMILTLVVSLYALYNTFVKFNIWSILSYLLCSLVIFVLYKDVILWCLKYGLDMLKNRKSQSNRPK